MPQLRTLLFASLLAGALPACSSSEPTAAACNPSDPSCPKVDASTPSDGGADVVSNGDAASTLDGDASCPPYVDEAGVTHGCGPGSHGPGDRDDGGGMEASIPDVAQDATNLPLGSPCWDNAQCVSNVCFDYKAKGQFCTKTCTSNADCPAPSLGCNGMGFCREGT